jgi:hypothetical protein
MAVLKVAARKKSATIVVNGKPKFPINDKRHASLALGRLNQAVPALTPAQKATVRARANKFLKKKG